MYNLLKKDLFSLFFLIISTALVLGFIQACGKTSATTDTTATGTISLNLKVNN